MSDTTELVDLAVIFPDLEIELKYACVDNITGKAIYQQVNRPGFPGECFICEL
ncbi:hypothetical protein FE448_004341, partial [Escherichia coli]|nr:hypothetical protein [Escherichia coli]